MGGLTNLIALDLTDNQISGEIPGDVAKLENVDTFYIDGNQNLIVRWSRCRNGWPMSIRGSVQQMRRELSERMTGMSQRCKDLSFAWSPMLP